MHFFWSGSMSDHKVPKVTWEWWILQKDKGGLGIINIEEMANKLASKCILRSLYKPEENWAGLIHRNLNQATLQHHKKWKNLLPITLFYNAWPVKPKVAPSFNLFEKRRTKLKGSPPLEPTKLLWWPPHWNQSGSISLNHNTLAYPILKEHSHCTKKGSDSERISRTPPPLVGQIYRN